MKDLRVLCPTSCPISYKGSRKMTTLQRELDNPIQMIPCEMLREIFVHCLPTHPLDHMQPNRTIAPMLLCQVCFSWRKVALEYPALWSHLAYGLTIIDDNFSHHTTWALRHQLEFLSFWKNNSSSTPLFLRLIVHRQGALASEDDAVSLSSVEANFLPKYLTSAQYLRCNAIYWSLARQWMEMGCLEICHPNLHTIIVQRQWFRPDAFYNFETLMESRRRDPTGNISLPTLRRLLISEGEVSDGFLVPSHWFALTHISMSDIVFSVDFWFSLIRAVPFLEWAYFDIKELTNFRSFKEPASCTLHHLSSFFIYCCRDCPNTSPSFRFPLSLLFRGLLLPNLHTLSTSSYESTWGEAQGGQGIIELYAMLKSTPAATTIALRGGFLPFGYRRTIDHNVTPIWIRVPRLTDLILELPDVGYYSVSAAINRFNLYLYAVLFESDWLSLEAAGCPIKSITLVNAHLSQEHFVATARCIESYALRAPRVAFELISDSEQLALSDLHRKWVSAL